MKKFMMFLFLLVPVVLLAQQDTVVINPPTGWGDVIFNFPSWFATFGGIAILTAFIAAFLNGLLKVTKSFVKQLVAWTVAILLMVISDLVNFGYAKDFPILLAVVHGLAAGLAANGVFDIPFLKGILDKISGWFVKE